MLRVELKKIKNCVLWITIFLHAHPDCILGKISKETESEKWCLWWGGWVGGFVCLLLIRLEESK